jgi:hypothetical protein
VVLSAGDRKTLCLTSGEVQAMGNFLALRDVSLNSNTAYFFKIGWN